jgi:hypothetical protein
VVFGTTLDWGVNMAALCPESEAQVTTPTALTWNCCMNPIS